MKLLEKLLHIIYPPRCVFCHRVLEQDDKICSDCCTDLPYYPSKKQPFSLPYVDECYAPFYYEEMVKDAILRFKFYNARGNADVFAEMMAEIFNRDLFGRVDLITWVPISRRRLRKRGYDQSEELTIALCNRIGRTPTRTIRKIRDNKPQSKQKNHAGRRANVMGVYQTTETSVCGKAILLIDDVVTTGNTVSECAHVLRVAGATKVYVLAVAKTPGAEKKIESYKK